MPLMLTGRVYNYCDYHCTDSKVSSEQPSGGVTVFGTGKHLITIASFLEATQAYLLHNMFYPL